ncbi:MAG: glutamate--tRNA ligase, partial [Nitrosopumilus sp.]|nr:glutamate--tRNA ligase [Nitrosopumilus sp.]
MILDDKLVNTIKLISLKNAIDFNNNIKPEVVISKTFSYVKDSKKNIKDIIPEIKKIISELSSLSLDEKKVLYDKIINDQNHFLTNLNTGNNQPILKNDGENKNQIPEKKSTDNQQLPVLPQLIGANYGDVVTRFPPEPNGYPHIGHAKAAIIDEEYARMYNGKLILRFDDTNPVKEKLEYYAAIAEGLEWLKVKPSIVKNTSDDMGILYEYGRKLIQRNCAYVCECNPELIKVNRSNGVSCNCRSNEVEHNLNEFENMIAGEYRQNECIVRYSGEMDSLNTAMRDPTLFRIIEGSHPKLGNKYT